MSDLDNTSDSPLSVFLEMDCFSLRAQKDFHLCTLKEIWTFIKNLKNDRASHCENNFQNFYIEFRKRVQKEIYPSILWKLFKLHFWLNSVWSISFGLDDNHLYWLFIQIVYKFKNLITFCSCTTLYTRCSVMDVLG